MQNVDEILEQLYAQKQSLLKEKAENIKKIQDIEIKIEYYESIMNRFNLLYRQMKIKLAECKGNAKKYDLYLKEQRGYRKRRQRAFKSKIILNSQMNYLIDRNSQIDNEVMDINEKINDMTVKPKILRRVKR